MRGYNLTIGNLVNGNSNNPDAFKKDICQYLVWDFGEHKEELTNSIIESVKKLKLDEQYTYNDIKFKCIEICPKCSKNLTTLKNEDIFKDNYIYQAREYFKGIIDLCMDICNCGWQSGIYEVIRNKK